MSHGGRWRKQWRIRRKQQVFLLKNIRVFGVVTIITKQRQILLCVIAILFDFQPKRLFAA